MPFFGQPTEFDQTGDIEMNKRKLGKSGLEVAPLAFGGNVFGWTTDEATSFALLDAFVDTGFDLVDTADVYSAWVPSHKGGESEVIIGKWLKSRGRRERVVIATKAGWEIRNFGKGLSQAHVVKSVEASLARLQTDFIDLYQSHIDDAETPFEETLAAYAKLIEQGKVRAIGASNHTAPRLGEALKVSAEKHLPRFQSLQPLYNLYDREDFESALQPLCVQEDIGVIPYYALAAGFLTGKYRSEKDLGQSARGGGVGSKYLNERGLRILGALDKVAKARSATPAQIAIAWLIARPAVTAAIASATSLKQFAELQKAATLTLDDESMGELDHASAVGPKVGAA
jgi:aryl-alcohol dehydrogenase-like predicted oxidoreductase